ncbi:hypothetical protein NC653_029920 [Populus alba x Populus x berolinensis]|uniref:Uncharacterized protein n=1 Tax=Populus alba x Populus x berolinensis TaxID=444605 RepID=A0AAD6M612_9ROSI|nr:hypothetical protein NC653_029920 [Populus alba x Populus x berolinensis]
MQSVCICSRFVASTTGLFCSSISILIPQSLSFPPIAQIIHKCKACYLLFR